MTKLGLAFGVVAVAGCAMPPLGLGTGAAAPTARSHWIATAGVGAASGRSVVQGELAHTKRYSDHFELECGVAVTQATIERRVTHGLAIGLGVIPYARPRWRIGRASFAVGGTAGLASGGESGSAGALIDVELGYGEQRWSIYGGGYGLAFASAPTPWTLAAQLRVGGEWLGARGSHAIGIAAELFYGGDAITTEGPHTDWSRVAGFALKLRERW